MFKALKHLVDTHSLLSLKLSFHTDHVFLRAACWSRLAPPSDLLPRNPVKVPRIGGPTGGCPASLQMVGRSEQAVRMVPLAVCTDSHSPCCRLLLCVLTARKAQLPLVVRADRLIIVSHFVAVRRCSLACGLQVPTTLDDVMFYQGLCIILDVCGN